MIKFWKLTCFSFTACSIDLHVLIFSIYVRLMFLLSRLTRNPAIKDGKSVKKPTTTSVKTAFYTAVNTSSWNILQCERTHGKQHMPIFPFVHDQNSFHLWSYHYHNSWHFAKMFPCPYNVTLSGLESCLCLFASGSLTAVAIISCEPSR